MSEKLIIVYEFSSFWDKLKELRKKLQYQLRDKSPEIVDASVMTASELVENAIKYGKSEISFNLSVENDILTIRVTNSVVEGPDLDAFTEFIGKIRECDDLNALYTARLMELMNDAHSGPTRLGLIRIAYEGKFDLNYTKEDEVIMVTATREMV